MSDTYSVETVDIYDHARAEIAIARENGADPARIALTHMQLASVMQHLLRRELEGPTA